MKATYRYLLLLLLFVFAGELALGQMQRFPKPEFQTDYQVPETVTEPPRSVMLEYLDLALLAAVMSLTVYFIFRKRSRRGIFWLSVFSLLYFGFYRNGCICSVGSVQNVALSLFGNQYAIPLSVLGFFLLPIVFSFFFGRVFCASACPLGAIQDMVIVKPLKLPPWLQSTLGLFPFIYLALAVLYAATNTDFMICRYDPFVGLFRMGATFHMVVLGISFLLIGMFVARPYCRFVCPYGAILKVCSYFSRKHLSITPSSCINCKLCKDACPFDAIDYPDESKAQKASVNDGKKLRFYLLLTPVLILAFGWLVSASSGLLSKAHPDVELAHRLLTNPALMQGSRDINVEAFLSSGRTLETLIEEATFIQGRFRKGGWFAGGFIGLVIGLSLLNQVVYRKKTMYEANKADCLSCGRCMDYCPVDKPDHPYHAEAKHHDAV